MFIIDVPNLDLFTIYKTSQAVSWRRGYGNVYVIVDGPNVLKAKQNGSKLLLDCSEDVFFNYWYDYFDVGEDYDEINSRLSKASPWLAKCVDEFKGLRLVKRHTYEALMYSILEDSMGASESSSTSYRLISQFCGTKHSNAMGDSGRVNWREFPTPCQIVDDVKKVAMASNKFFASKAEELSWDIIDEWIEVDHLPSTNEGFESYLSTKAIEEAWLFGMGDKSMFPRNEKVMRSAKVHHGMEFDLFKDWYLDEIKDIAGIAYVYMKAMVEKERKAGARWV